MEEVALEIGEMEIGSSLRTHSRQREGARKGWEQQGQSLEWEERE